MLQTILLDERKLYHLERCGERKIAGVPKNLRIFRDFRVLVTLCGSCGAQAKGRAEAKAAGLGVRGQESGVEIKCRCREEVYSSLVKS